MRIMIVGSTYYPSLNGQSIFTTNLCEGLASQGHQVMAVVPSESSHAHQFWRNGVLIQKISAVEFSFIHPEVYYTPFPSKLVKKVFKEFDPEVVHVQDHHPLSASALKIARRHRLPVMGTNHFMPQNLAPYFPWLARFEAVFEGIMWKWMLSLFNRLDLAAAPSRTAASILRSNGLCIPVTPVSCGVDLHRFYPIRNLDRKAILRQYGLDPQKITFVFVGRVDGEKRLDVIIQAIHKLQRADIQLAIVGQGMAEKKYQGLVYELNLQEQVHFTGFIAGDELPRFINCADLFVMPSEAELLSIATLEAMACAKPILASNALALPELVAEGKNGYLFPAGDVSAAARLMKTLIDQRKLWPEMGKASLNKARQHSLDNTISSYENLYCLLQQGEYAIRTTPYPERITARKGRMQDDAAKIW